jgi:hypothetical protein
MYTGYNNAGELIISFPPLFMFAHLIYFSGAIISAGTIWPSMNCEEICRCCVSNLPFTMGSYESVAERSAWKECEKRGEGERK